MNATEKLHFYNAKIIFCLHKCGQKTLYFLTALYHKLMI
ncbi:protein SprT [Aggregatibacter aphrophilus NJ8700]|nr:protein SprT [Aggregatibacter aphrophilus NJ8700]